MKFTKNKWYRVSGLIMIPLGLFLTFKGLTTHGYAPGDVHWVKFGPVGLMSIVGGIGLLFLPEKIKF